MYDRLRNRLDDGRQSGFTLIELLIVIVILGILAAIVVFAVGSARDDSVKNSCKADAKTVNTAAEAYKAKKGVYPTSAEMTASGADQVLKAFPSSTEYKITYTQSTGVATGNLKADGSGAAC